jgi:hypothetical protein
VKISGWSFAVLRRSTTIRALFDKRATICSVKMQKNLESIEKTQKVNPTKLIPHSTKSQKKNSYNNFFRMNVIATFSTDSKLASYSFFIPILNIC